MRFTPALRTAAGHLGGAALRQGPLEAAALRGDLAPITRHLSPAVAKLTVGFFVCPFLCFRMPAFDPAAPARDPPLSLSPPHPAIRTPHTPPPRTPPPPP